MNNTNPNNSSNMTTPTCGCGLLPCQSGTLKLGCSHGRHVKYSPMVPEPADEATGSLGEVIIRPQFAMLAKEKNHSTDVLEINLETIDNPDCPDPKNCPKIIVTDLDSGDIIAEGKNQLQVDLRYSELLIFQALETISNGGNLGDVANLKVDEWELLMTVVWAFLSNDFSEIRHKYSIHVVNHDDRSENNVGVSLYPELVVKASDLFLKLSGTVNSSGRFKVALGISGSASVQIGAKEYGVHAEAAFVDNIRKLNIIFPGLGNFLESQMSVADDTKKSKSYVKLNTALGLKECKSSLVEDPNSPSHVGTEIEATIGASPLIKGTVYVDILDLLCKCSGGLGAAASKVREISENGIETNIASAELSLAVFFKGAIDISLEGTWFKSIGDKEISFDSAGGRIAIPVEVGLELEAKARLTVIEGTMNIHGGAKGEFLGEIKYKPHEDKCWKWSVGHDGFMIYWGGEFKIGKGAPKPKPKRGRPPNHRTGFEADLEPFENYDNHYMLIEPDPYFFSDS